MVLWFCGSDGSGFCGSGGSVVLDSMVLGSVVLMALGSGFCGSDGSVVLWLWF